MVTASTNPVSHITPDNDVVTAEIFIAAPRERIFQALTDPRQALQWWGQNGKYRLREFHMDVRVGGKWSCAGQSVTMGGPINIGGEFLQVDPPRYSLTPGPQAGCRYPPKSGGNWKPRAAAHC